MLAHVGSLSHKMVCLAPLAYIKEDFNISEGFSLSNIGVSGKNRVYNVLSENNDCYISDVPKRLWVSK